MRRHRFVFSRVFRERTRGNKNDTARVVKHWNRLSREAVELPLWGIFKTELNGLSNLPSMDQSRTPDWARRLPEVISSLIILCFHALLFMHFLFFP